MPIFIVIFSRTTTGRVLLEFLDKHDKGNPFFYMKSGRVKDDSKSYWGQKFNNLVQLHGRLTRLDSAALPLNQWLPTGNPLDFIIRWRVSCWGGVDG